MPLNRNWVNSFRTRPKHCPTNNPRVLQSMAMIFYNQCTATAIRRCGQGCVVPNRLRFLWFCRKNSKNCPEVLRNDVAEPVQPFRGTVLKWRPRDRNVSIHNGSPFRLMFGNIFCIWMCWNREGYEWIYRCFSIFVPHSQQLVPC